MMKKGLVILAFLCIIAAITYATTGRKKAGDEIKEESAEVIFRLNEHTDNSLSDIPELAGMDRLIDKYLEKWDIRGASLAVVRNDSLVYAKGYGWADKEMGVEMQPNNILRMASVSKLITAAGIMHLQEEGLLNIKDTVFGPRGILTDSLYSGTIRDKNYYKITVEHLLRHQGGFYRDPMFSALDVMHQMNLDSPPTNDDYIRLVLKRPLRFMPGEWEKYSNFGYMLLSRIIEKVSGQEYEAFIQENILKPAGCYDMHICYNYYEDRFPGEVRYYTHEGDGKFIQEYNGSGNTVERCYGGNDIRNLSGAGAWCGSTIELARFISSIDGKPEVPDILSPESISMMTEYFDKETFSLGWNDTDPEKGWTRTGTLSGTSALAKYFPDNECWIMITNTSTWKGPGQTKVTDALFHECREKYGNLLPHTNLFGS